MYSMFYKAEFFNRPLNKWNVSNVTDMTFMFFGATSFTPSDGPSSDEERSMCSTDSLSAFFPADPITRELLEDDLLAMPLDSLAYFDANDTLDFGALLPSIFDAEDPTEGV